MSINKNNCDKCGETYEVPVWSQRSEIPESYKWKLEDIFADDLHWESAFNDISQIAAGLIGYKGKINSSSAALAEALHAETRLDQALGELIAYARMRRDEDNSRPLYQEMTDRVMSLYFKIAQDAAFLEPEISAISEKDLLAWLDQEPALETFRHRLMNQIRQRPHVLSEAEERLLSKFGSVSQGLDDIHTMIDNVDIKLGTITDENDQEIELTMSKFAQLRDHRNRRMRADAFESVHKAYGNLGNTLAALYSTQVRSDYVYASTREFDSTLSSALFSDNLTASLYQNLVDAVQAAQPIMYNYLNIRRDILKLDDLHIYDTYLPLIQSPKKRYSYEQACELVLKALEPLGEEYGSLLRRHLTERWIDVYETPNKTNGAYSWGTYKTHPYILLNYSGTMTDVFTLAHELGHSMHTLLSSKKPYEQSHYPIFLAEIASTVNENLLMNYLISQCDQKTDAGRMEKAWLLNHHLEGFRLTVFRQTMFAEFEQKAHAMSQNAGVLNADSLNRLYLDLLRQYFGPETVIDDFMKWEWSRIPHFFNSFYVYKYATGFACAIAIAARINAGQPGAVSDYIGFLSSGGSDYPLALLKKTGIDLSRPEPLQDAMQVFSDTLAEFISLANLTGVGGQDGN